MAPEQTGRTGRVVDHRTDLYSLGVMLYELVLGYRPFEGDDPLDLIHKHLVRAPVPPIAADPALPPALSDIVMRLLEKEADHRYQSADGLVEDLALLLVVLKNGEPVRFTLGQHDFPLRLAPPSHLIGRDHEVDQLRRALDDAVRGCCRALFIAGDAGVGKSALINELRSLVTARRGWFVSGKFDDYSKDAPSATVQAFRALGRLLLAEPEPELVAYREGLLQALGPNLGYGPSALPEFNLLLGDVPRILASNPAEDEARMFQASVDMLRRIAAPDRPLVMVIEDLHAASEITARYLTTLLMASPPLPGFLLVGSYRGADISATHPIGAARGGWEANGVAPAELQLRNLSTADLNILLGEMLRLSPDNAAPLGEVLWARTNGNPNDTVELINALRVDGLLVPQNDTWVWDAAAIQRYVGKCEVVDLLNRRIERLPDSAQLLLQFMACISGQVSFDLLRLATGTPLADIEVQLAPALDDGLLVLEQGQCGTLRYAFAMTACSRRY